MCREKKTRKKGHEKKDTKKGREGKKEFCILILLSKSFIYFFLRARFL